MLADAILTQYSGFIEVADTGSLNLAAENLILRPPR
jgi:hypothetical protein